MKIGSNIFYQMEKILLKRLILTFGVTIDFDCSICIKNWYLVLVAPKAMVFVLVPAFRKGGPYGEKGSLRQIIEFEFVLFFIGQNSKTFPVNSISPEVQRLLDDNFFLPVNYPEAHSCH